MARTGIREEEVFDHKMLEVEVQAEKRQASWVGELVTGTDWRKPHCRTPKEWRFSRALPWRYYQPPSRPC